MRGGSQQGAGAGSQQGAGAGSQQGAGAGSQQGAGAGAGAQQGAGAGAGAQQGAGAGAGAQQGAGAGAGAQQGAGAGAGAQQGAGAGSQQGVALRAAQRALMRSHRLTRAGLQQTVGAGSQQGAGSQPRDLQQLKIPASAVFAEKTIVAATSASKMRFIGGLLVLNQLIASLQTDAVKMSVKGCLLAGESKTGVYLCQ